MCTSQMCQEITASNPLVTVRCACVQYITAFILIWIICLTHLPKKRSYIYTFLTCFDLFLHERDAARGGFNCQRNHVNILNGPVLLLIIWMYRQSAALQDFSRSVWFWVRREIYMGAGWRTVSRAGHIIEVCPTTGLILPAVPFTYRPVQRAEVTKTIFLWQNCLTDTDPPLNRSADKPSKPKALLKNISKRRKTVTLTSSSCFLFSFTLNEPYMGLYDLRSNKDAKWSDLN